MRVVSIVGARPQFIKVAPISWRAEQSNEHLILHTGQHYDPELSSNFFSELEIPEPVANLYSGSGNHGAQTARILAGIEESLLSLKPEWVLVYGDTNSTIAATSGVYEIDMKFNSSNKMIAATTSSGIYISLDFGKTWKKYTLDNATNYYNLTFADNYLFVGTNIGVYRTKL